MSSRTDSFPHESMLSPKHQWKKYQIEITHHLSTIPSPSTISDAINDTLFQILNSGAKVINQKPIPETNHDHIETIEATNKAILDNVDAYIIGQHSCKNNVYYHLHIEIPTTFSKYKKSSSHG